MQCGNNTEVIFKMRGSLTIENSYFSYKFNDL